MNLQESIEKIAICRLKIGDTSLLYSVVSSGIWGEIYPIQTKVHKQILVEVSGLYLVDMSPW